MIDTIEGFPQLQLLSWGLDCVDAVILRYIVDSYRTGKMPKCTIADRGEFFWIKYSTLIAEIPIIGIKNKEALARRMKKFSECGLMDHIRYTEQGTFSYYQFNKNALKLITTEKLYPDDPLRRNHKTEHILCSAHK